MAMDMSRYLGLFVTEASEHLEALGRDLVQLEKGGGASSVDSMFRHAHSVKGMASSMGFEPIATLAHRVEDLVDAVRQDSSRLNRELVDLLLSATDTMLAQVRLVAENKSPEEAGTLLTQLAGRVSALTGQAPAPTRVMKTTALRTPVPLPRGPEAGAPSPAQGPVTPVPMRAETAAPGAGAAPALAAPQVLAEVKLEAGPQARWSVKVRVVPACQVPGVRAFLVHKRLSGLGTVSEVRPPLEDLKAGRIPDGLIQCEVETSAGEQGIQGALRNVSEVELVSIKPVIFASPPTAVPASTAEASRATGEAAPRTVRVRTELLDYFLDTVGELMLATARLREVGKALPENVRPPLEEGVYRLHALVKDLHDKVMSARMTPLSLITDRLPRAARDIARKRGRDMDLVITGAEIELDRAILDDLVDPMMHILRNCIDHGLEAPEERAAAGKSPKGKVQVSVRRVRDRVVIEVEDDGRGMSAEKLKAAALARNAITAEAVARLSDREAFMLACLPGVSTAKAVSEISGRGVGMDAVKRVVENVGGTLEIDSEKGKGTRFTLRLPLTVAVVHLLLVQVGEEVFGIPIAKVVGAQEVDSDVLSRSRDTALLPHGNTLLPVHALDVLVGLPAPERRGVRPFVVMEGDSGKVALAVDRLLGQEEVVLKSLSRPLDLLPGLSGVTILGSGRPVFILDVPRLLSA
jgi:two-component system chemotaxis sensor kinase CheA